MTDHPKRLLIVGGSLYHPGGLESFCERALHAVQGLGEGWEARWLPANTAYMTVKRLPKLYRGIRKLVRHRRRGPAGLVWVQFSNMPDLLYLVVARMLGFRILVTPHLGANSRLQRSAVLRGLSGWLLRRADRIALLFEGQDTDISLPADRPRSVLRTFLPQRSLSPPESAAAGAAIRLIHAGRLSRPKGSFLMVDICAALKQAGVPFTGRLIGRADSATGALLRRHISERGLEHELSLTSWLPENDLHHALVEADVLVHLSELDSYPLIVLEAMAAGAVPVALDMAGVRAMTSDYDGIVVPGHAAVERAAAWLIDQDLAALRERGAAMGARVRSDFSWESCIARLMPILDATLRARSAAR